jgi:hypothetical protein
MWSVYYLKQNKRDFEIWMSNTETLNSLGDKVHERSFTIMTAIIGGGDVNYEAMTHSRRITDCQERVTDLIKLPQIFITNRSGYCVWFVILR